MKSYKVFIHVVSRRVEMINVLVKPVGTTLLSDYMVLFIVN